MMYQQITVSTPDQNNTGVATLTGLVQRPTSLMAWLEITRLTDWMFCKHAGLGWEECSGECELCEGRRIRLSVGL